ncbi:hypothetical protein BDY17DRAFT_328097 [Neohortaea acidophila]|uniref:N-acetyltransferase domain-containing protein n=1 Tax=Neohortaea acidophila TaxID=245834 RepID=A0A6A6PGY5_9PEZI|nr:uncharacterized protein BDY17DRAFT_328097 [Neohortaea acidophila]KAF2478557.1 hypothetical protein BDY17DRAFT_328097 [Neohortaea acidophila]
MDKEVKITSGGKDRLLQATKVLTKCFWDDPVVRFMMSSMTDEARKAYYPAYMHSLLKAAALNAAIFTEAADWACVAVWLLPGKTVDNPFTMLQAGLLGCLWRLGVVGVKRMLVDYQGQSGDCKRRFLVDAHGKRFTRYHYLFFIGTDPAARGQGLASRLIKEYQQKAAAEGLPIWLEATTPRSRDVYAKVGFEETTMMKLGEGTHAASGVPETGGPGVCIWPMIWLPPSMQSGRIDAAKQ